MAGVWEVWQIAIVWIAGERGLYDLLAPIGQVEVKIDYEANRNLWFLLARAMESVAVGVVREFAGHTGNPEGRRAWIKLQDVYGGMTAEGGTQIGGDGLYRPRRDSQLPDGTWGALGPLRELR